MSVFKGKYAARFEVITPNNHGFESEQSIVQ